MVFSITEYGQLAEISASTIRYYENENLLPKAERRGGKRVYYANDIPRLKLIVAARKTGFGIKEIKRIVSQTEFDGRSLKDAVISAAIRKTNSIDQQIQTLNAQRGLLVDAQACLCDDLSRCSIYG